MKDKYNDNNSESGLTLVEILAGIVILALMILTIAVVFTQTARTNKASENILDATYVAQTELEHINNISKETNPELRDTEGYQQQPNEADWQIFHKQINNTNYFVEIRLKDADTSDQDDHGYLAR